MSLFDIQLGVMLNQIGAEQLDCGSAFVAVEFFLIAHSLLCQRAALPLHLPVASDYPHMDDIPNISTTRCCFIFNDAVLFNIPLLHQHGLGISSSTVLQILRTSTVLNVSIALHRVALHCGKQALWDRAKLAYQSVLRLLPSIDQRHGILIGVFAVQNLAVLHYEQCEYAECQKCLQILRWFLWRDLREASPVLGLDVVRKVALAIIFYANPPTTAACA